MIADLVFGAWASSAVWALRVMARLVLPVALDRCPFDWAHGEGPL